MTRGPRIVFASYMIRYPLGGMISYVLQWLVGLQRLGCEVVFVECANYHNACYDPVRNSVGDDPSTGLEIVGDVLAAHGLEDAMCFRDVHGAHFGMSGDTLRKAFRDADAFIDMGTHGAWLDHVAPGCRTVLIDGEPGFRQIDWELKRRMGDPLPVYDLHFTNGGCIGTGSYLGPTAGIDWIPIYNPVVVDLFDPVPVPNDGCFTTVMNWQAHKPLVFEGRTYGQKDIEFERFMSMPLDTSARLEVAVAGSNAPLARLEENGWQATDAISATISLHAYKDYIARSLGEFSICKNVFRQTRSGWFSERSAAYLASARPCVLQDTGFSELLPVGRGLHAFDTTDEALAGLDLVMSDPQGEGRKARELAAAYFAHDVVLPRFLREIGLV